MGQAVEGVEVGGIRQGNREIVVVLEHRHHAVLFRNVARNGGDHIVLDAHFTQVDHLGPEMRRLGLGDIGGADDLVGQHQIHHTDS